MAVFEADIERMLALELKDKLLTLYADILPIWGMINSWKLNDLDPLLPDPFNVRVALEQYRALRLERLLLQDAVSDFLQAEIGDTLTYPTPPEETWPWIFSEDLIFSPSLIF